MRTRFFAPGLVILAGCGASLQPGITGLAATTLSPPAAGATSATGSLPFRTLASEWGSGSYFAAGKSETLVLNSAADLTAFVARHSPAVSIAPQPTASFGPPGSITVVSTPGPAFQPRQLPDTLTQLDFSKYEALVFFDGAVKVASTSRIVAVQDQGGKLVASTERWEPPANPAAIPDVDGRLHVIALARTSEPVVFGPTTVVNGAAPDNGFGYSLGGNPNMDPQWPAVPNPDVTQASVEANMRKARQGQTITSLSVSQESVATAYAEEPKLLPPFNARPSNPTRFTSDSQVWVVRLQGQVSTYPTISMPGPIGELPTTSSLTEIISPEDGEEMTEFSTATPPFHYALANQGLQHVGDVLTIATVGQVPSAQSVTLTVSREGRQLVTQTINDTDLASFKLPLDAAHLGNVALWPTEDINVRLSSGDESLSATLTLTSDANALPSPPEGGGRQMQPGEASVDAAVGNYAREIATNDWKGTNLTFTSRQTTVEDVALDVGRPDEPSDNTPVRTFEIHGTFPDYDLPGVLTASGDAAVMKPTVLRLVLTVGEFMQVASERADTQ